MQPTPADGRSITHSDQHKAQCSENILSTPQSRLRLHDHYSRGNSGVGEFQLPVSGEEDLIKNSSVGKNSATTRCSDIEDSRKTFSKLPKPQEKVRQTVRQTRSSNLQAQEKSNPSPELKDSTDQISVEIPRPEPQRTEPMPDAASKPSQAQRTSDEKAEITKKASRRLSADDMRALTHDYFTFDWDARELSRLQLSTLGMANLFSV